MAILFLFLLVVALEGHASEVPKEAGQHDESGWRLVAVMPWRAEGQELRCIVEERQVVPGSDIPDRRVVFDRAGSDRPEAIATFVWYQDFVLGFPLFGDAGGPFLTVWGAGSGYVVRVFMFREGKVELALDQVSSVSSIPELLDLEGPHTFALVVPEDFEWKLNAAGERYRVLLPAVYIWDGRRFSRRACESWEKRVECALSRGVK
jgi:hypothetical protein